MAVDSHIQIPDSFLKRFSHQCDEDALINGKPFKNKLHLVWYLDLKTGVYGEENTKKFYTSFRYYNDENEDLLSKYFESPIGDIIVKIKDSIKKGLVPQFKEIDFKTINGFITITLARSQEIYKKIYSISKGEIDKDRLIQLAYEVIEKSPIKYNYIEILRNLSGEDFVIPTCCSANFNKDIVIPLLPNLALQVKQSENKCLIVNMRNINDAKEINEINLAAIAKESNYHGVVVFNTKEQLLRIAKQLKLNVKEKECN